MKSGARKPGWPIPRLMMSRPCAASALARASTAKAFSSPMRSKASIVFSMGRVPAGVNGRQFTRSGDENQTAQSVLATEPAADIAPDLRADERVGIVAHVGAAVVVERAG